MARRVIASAALAEAPRRLAWTGEKQQHPLIQRPPARVDASVTGRHAEWAAILLDAPRAQAAYVFVLWGSQPACSQFDELFGAILALRDTAPVHDIVALLTEAWSSLSWPTTELRRHGVRVGTVRNTEHVACQDEYRDNKAYLAGSWTIYSIWSLTAYDAVLYMDSDSQVMHNVDHVFELMLRGRSSVLQMGKQGVCGRWGGMNTGVWMVRPNASVFAQLRDMLRSGRPRFHCDIGFQGGVNAFFRDNSKRQFWTSKTNKCNLWMEPLNATYNCNTISMAPCGPGGFAHIVHWSGNPKPNHPSLWDKASGAPRPFINYTDGNVTKYHIRARMHPLQAEAISSYMRNTRRAARLHRGCIHTGSVSLAPERIV